MVLESKEEETFEQVGNVFPDEYNLEVLEADVSVSDALDRMARHRFNQLPVMERGLLIGVFSLWSLTEHLRYEPRPDLDELYVGDLTENLPKVTVDDDLYEILKLLQRHEALLVGTPDELQAITTAWDVLDYFYRVARPYVVLREIERSLRTIIDECLEDDLFHHAVDRTLATKYKNTNRKLPTTLSEMTFRDYATLIGSRVAWEHFEGILGRNRSFIQSRLGIVAEIRNEVFHFRNDELNVEDFETLIAERQRLLNAINRLTREDAS